MFQCFICFNRPPVKYQKSEKNNTAGFVASLPRELTDSDSNQQTDSVAIAITPLDEAAFNAAVFFCRRQTEEWFCFSILVVRTTGAHASVKVVLSNTIFSPGLKAGMPKYGQLAQRKASPR